MGELRDVLTMLAPHAVLVGSAARGPHYNDIDLVVSDKGLQIAKDVLAPWSSPFIGAVSSEELETRVEVFRYWYGPGYSALRRSRKLVTVMVEGVEFKAWPIDTRDAKGGAK